MAIFRKQGRKDLSPAAASPSGAVASSDDDIASFVEAVRRAPAAGKGQGRLIFAMDATMSRQPSWDRALAIQAEMFRETASIGGLSVQLIYYRGFGECRASKWVRDGDALARLMSGVACRGGHTQIGKILSHARKAAETEPVAALVFVGDAMEEDIDHLAELAGQLGLVRVPAFMFHEGGDNLAERAFREIARLSGGAYCRFSSSSPDELRKLLAAVAVYAAGGRKALEARPREPAVTALLEQLR